MESSVSAANFYARQASQQSTSNDRYLIYVAIAYSSCHGADDAGKKRFHCIMRYLLPVELMLSLLASVDVNLLMLVVRIMVLICAFFNAEFIPKSTKKLWVMACEQAPVVWQWLRDKAPVVWQWLREQWEATERGRRERSAQGVRSRSHSPCRRYSEQENHQLLLMDGENHSEERGQGVDLSLPDGRAISQDVEQENTGKPVAPTSMIAGVQVEWGKTDVLRKRKNAEALARKKRKRDETLTADVESECACKKART